MDSNKAVTKNHYESLDFLPWLFFDLAPENTNNWHLPYIYTGIFLDEQLYYFFITQHLLQTVTGPIWKKNHIPKWKKKQIPKWKKIN